MAKDHSFDIVSKPNLQEIDNAIQMAMREIANRFDFKGSISKIEKEGDDKIKLVSEDEFKLKNVNNILQDKLIKRKIPLKFFEYGSLEESLGGQVKQMVTIQQGIPQEKAKEITKLIKTSGLKVQTQIQGDEIRVSAKKIDDLQATMEKLKAANLSIVLQFDNYR
ncbi:YajQ family cyclic di-GMP-binding protein [candidate division WOR-1 bacterium RIFOXYB2_FULL_42_35]|uniref:Nucleotide-binding protein A2462_05225 n=1 Tax=candidate division WOR-1 bacterium RIFOXYC2_FULL_41_25 TaxID=1802586 RepID=A0A1F4TQN6_UNCSA|nr:MAG: YajQ family cyclic di-GMP-binding protein [candidate division WOR-1 bacterium RIFOXYA2_FULL_41_14]OGC25546.1 MAG: YajQ family cyclic di-GMP-binding protein [candidate division WOR-1 bacterium RIFOXYB2_FULL_42_35]OGC34978.1 MAG: YajQ family cyclic di-GMP-binding protein [candidate division WOR-1 bacterium RIFOXYC2_FULL_41_25]